MKSIVLSSVVTALLMFSGCSTTEPAVDTKADTQQGQDVNAMNTETVSGENSMVNSMAGGAAGAMTMADIENSLSPIYFAFDKFSIDAADQDRIAKAAEIGKTTAVDYSVKLEGNCDEWGSDEYNFALGLKRADAVKKALVAQGIDAKRISMVSYGESNPVCNDKTQACWAKNRRVDFKILP